MHTVGFTHIGRRKAFLEMNNEVRGYDPATDLKTYMEDNDIKVVKVGAPDMEGMWRGKRIMAEFFLKTVAEEGSHFADLFFAWDAQAEPITGLDYTGAHTGYPDLALVPDLSTLHMVAGEPGVAAVICDAFTPTGEPLELAPRGILQRVIHRAEEAGFNPVCAYEFEFYLFKGTPNELQRQGYSQLTPITDGIFPYSFTRDSSTEWIIGDIRDRLAKMGVLIEASNSEYGPGQIEVNIHYSDPLYAADSALILKNTVKEVAAEHGYTATFMAKVKSNVSGSSGHVHLSLLSRETGEPVFANPDSPRNLSELGMHFLSGVLHNAGAMSALYMPTPNAFKRAAAGDFSATNCTWGVDNRTVAIRSIPSGTHSARVENRLAGADANPYLVVAATIASGLDGIAKRLQPGEPVVGTAYELDDSNDLHLPATLEEAADSFAGSEVAKDYFGEPFVKHYARMRQWEVEQARLAVTDWEVQRYLERI